MSYVTLTEVKARLTNPDDYTDEQITAAIGLAKERIDLFMGMDDFFSVHSLSIVEEGIGGYYLYVTRTSLPLLELTGVKINDVEEDISQFQYDIGIHGLYYSLGFYDGDKVEITGKWGYEEIPLLAKECCLRLAIMILKDEEMKEGVGTEAIERVSVGGDVVFFQKRQPMTGTTGDDWIDRVLAQFKRRVYRIGAL
ncbi:MAG: hypothetical protein ACXQT6_05420 [Candidatus Methanospirareceae archaeon]